MEPPVLSQKGSPKEIQTSQDLQLSINLPPLELLKLSSAENQTGSSTINGDVTKPDKEEFPPLTGSIKPVSSQDGIKRSTWAGAVMKRPSLSKHNIEITMVDGSATIEIPKEVIDRSTPLWEDFLVGRFLSAAPHVAKINMIVNIIWPLKDKSNRIDVYVVDAKTIRFRIKDTQARLRVLKRGMWNIAEIPMIASKWRPIEEDDEPEIKTIPMWVHMKNVPSSLFSWEGLGFFACA